MKNKIEWIIIFQRKTPNFSDKHIIFRGLNYFLKYINYLYLFSKRFNLNAPMLVVLVLLLVVFESHLIN